MLGDQDELVRPNHLERWLEIAPAAATMLVRGAAHDIQNTEPEQSVEALSALHTSASA